MIYVDRSKTIPPEIYFSKEWEGYIQAAKDFYSQPEQERSQSRFDFVDVDEIWDLKMALIEEFQGKCAYSEAPINPKNCRIIRHRPRNGASDIDHSSDRNHYWWLAYEWENLIPVYDECARAKGHYFPVIGKRAKPKTNLSAVRKAESALLPDPSLPDLSTNLIFGQDGIVSAQSGYEPIVDILGLNSSNLVRRRKSAYREFSSSSKNLAPTHLKSFFTSHLTNDSYFLEARLQWLEIMIRMESAQPDAIISALSSLGRNYPELRIKKLIRFLESDQSTSKASIFRPSEVTQKKQSTPATLHPIQIEKIEIKNFKCIEQLVLELPQSDDLDSPNGLMVLGENGSGKSSILQAVALALDDPAKLTEHPFLTYKKVLRRGKHKGYVRLHLVDQNEPIEVSFSRTKFSFSGPRDQISFYLSAYGPHRIMPRYNDDSSEINIAPIISINNLWDPYESLVDAERWMLSLDKSAFDAFALALKDLLDLRSDGLIYRKNKQLFFNIGGDKQSLDDLSAGYKSIIATATDIIASYPIKGIDMHQATGIVMIDEIGAHLHPRWRMRIVQAYRRTFKGMQFLCTTHEPLCLRGTREKEVVVLVQDEGKVKRITDVPNLEEMRIDQILTSPIFGMNTTVDPDAERKFQEYYYLLAKQKLNGAERKRRDDLKQFLYRYGVLGTDRRSRAIYDIIDKDLATQNPEKQIKGISKGTRKKVLRIWKNTSFDFES